MKQLHKLIQKYDWRDISEEFAFFYPNQREKLSDFENAYNILKNTEPIKGEKCLICIDSVVLENEGYRDVYGVYPASDCNQAQTTSLSLASWPEWLGMRFTPETSNNYSETEIIAHCLIHITLLGFEPTYVKRHRDQLSEQLSRFNEDSEDTMSLEDVAKIFGIKTT